MTGLRALIFDVDGTLADTERDGHRVAFNQAFAQAGLDWQWSVELYGELLAVTGGKERICYFLDRYGPVRRHAGTDSELAASLHASKTRLYADLLSSGRIPLRPGVARLLAEAREDGLRLAIATTTTPENVTALLNYTLGEHALRWFEVIGAGDAVPNKKPAPDIYRHVMERMGLTPEACVALEDSGNGLRASLQARLSTVITTSDYTTHDDFTGAAIVVDQLGEPNAPFHVRAGDAHGHTHVDVALLRKLHRAAHG